MFRTAEKLTSAVVCDLVASLGLGMVSLSFAVVHFVLLNISTYYRGRLVRGANLQLVVNVRRFKAR